MPEQTQTIDELGILLDKLRALPLSEWKAEKPFKSAKEPNYFNTLGIYEVKACGKNNLSTDHSLIISNQQGLEITTYQLDGRVGDFYCELGNKFQRQRYKEAEQERKKEEPKRQEEERKFLKFLGIE